MIELNRAIGVIDSGVGGLTVAHEMMRQLPKEKLIYLGDTKRCPYGPRTKEEVQIFTWEMVNFLRLKQIKMLVIACNTATAFTLKDLQAKLDIPVIGVIQPGARAAIKTTKNGCVGVIGTEGTIRSDAYPQALKRIKADLQITALACPEFVPLVERGITSGPEADEIVAAALEPLKKIDNIDTLILGCTHYPLLKDTIQKTVGKRVAIISSSEETAREASTILDVHGLLYKEEAEPQHQFYTTGDLNIFTEISKSIFNSSVANLKTVKIEQAIIQ